MSEIRNEVLKLISLCNFDKIPKKFWKDKEIVLASVKKEGWALEYADEIFKKDKESQSWKEWECDRMTMVEHAWDLPSLLKIKKQSW